MPHTYKEPAIEVEGLRKVYHRIVAVDDVSFVMYHGEAFGFLGPNGAGKSTVVKILTGLVAPTRGTIRILGQPINNREMRRRIGYVPEIFWRFTVISTVCAVWNWKSALAKFWNW